MQSDRQQRMGLLGMWLFLAALTMLFGAGLAAYLVIRVTGSTQPTLGSIHMPMILWLSTALLIAASVAISAAGRALQSAAFHAANQRLLLTGIFTLGFLATQTLGLLQLLTMHRQQLADRVGTYGLVFALILLHALHVLGGLVPLAMLLIAVARQKLSQQHASLVKLTGMYWHFLDAVWIIMAITLAAVR